MTGDETQNSAIVVTGAGLVAALGLDRRAIWARVLAGESGIRDLTALEQKPLENKGGGEAPTLSDDESAALPREARYLRRAIREAMNEAKLPGSNTSPLDTASHRRGLVFGTTLHGMRAGGRFLREHSFEPLRTLLAPATLNLAAAGLACHGDAITTCSACSSGLAAIGLAITLLRAGELDAIVCGGYDPISEYAYAGFNSLRLIAGDQVRPFCTGREGMKLGEGYAAIVLERESDALARGAAPLARILGFAESADAHHLTQPHPDGDGAARAMLAALARAHLAPTDIDLVTAHATGTPDNDRGEAAALRQVLGDRLRETALVAFKSALGHTLGGAGAVELILSMMALNDGVIPPTLGASPAQLEFADLQPTPKAQPKPLRASLNTSIGFGGANASLALARADRFDPANARHTASPREAVITGIGVVLPGAIGNDPFSRYLLDPFRIAITADAPPIDDGSLAALVNARRVRRLSPYVKLSLAATTEAFRDAGIEGDAAFTADCSAILGSAHGSVAYSHDYYRELVAAGIEAANPMLFAEGVPNAAAAHLSMAFGIKGGCQTILGSRTSGLDALRLAALRIATGECDRVIVSAAEEASPLVNEAYAHCGHHYRKSGNTAVAPSTAGLPFDDRGFATGCGAVTLILESRESAQRRGTKPRAIVGRSACAFISPALDSRRRVKLLRAVAAPLANVRGIICSANATALDRIELAALAAAPATLTSIAGHVAECFSVTPLAALAAALLTGRLPRLLGDGPPHAPHLQAAAGDEPLDSFAILCGDYAGALTAVRIDRIK